MKVSGRPLEASGRPNEAFGKPHERLHEAPGRPLRGYLNGHFRQLEGHMIPREGHFKHAGDLDCLDTSGGLLALRGLVQASCGPPNASHSLPNTSVAFKIPCELLNASSGLPYPSGSQVAYWKPQVA